MELTIPRPGAKDAIFAATLAMLAVTAANTIVHPALVLALCTGCLLALAILARPELGLWLVVLLTPIEAVGPLSFSTSKGAKLSLTLLVTTALLLTHRRDQASTRDAYRWPFLLIVTSGLLSSVLAKSPLTSILGLAAIAIFVLFYASLKRSGVLVDKGSLLLRIVIWSAVLSTGVCFMQMLSGYGGVLGAVEHQSLEAEEAFSTVWPGISRASATFNGPNAAGAFFALAAIAALTHAVVIRKGRLWYLLATLICVADALTTFSRGALLGCITGFVFACWGMGLLRKKRLLVLGLCSGTLLVGVAATESVQKYLRIGVDLASVSPERMDAWQAAKVIVKRNPLVGIGFYQFHDASQGIAGMADMPLHPHNGFLKAQVELGAVGAFAYALFILVFVRRSRETLRGQVSPEQRWVLGAIAGCGVCLFSQELFDANFTLGGSSVAILFASMLAIQSSYQMGSPTAPPLANES